MAIRTGTAGSDTLTGTVQSDLIRAGAGDDRIIPLDDDDEIHGGRGLDIVIYDTAPAGIVANLQTGVIDDGFGGTDLVDNVEGVIGSPFDDVIRGDDADNVLAGRRGADMLIGRHGADDLGGGAGADVLMGGRGGDELRGGRGQDELTGNRGKDQLSGGDGRDTLAGNSGRDQLNGGSGDDELTGGRGFDEFVFDGLLDGQDTITDFAPGVDSIRITDVVDNGLEDVIVGLEAAPEPGSSVLTITPSPGAETTDLAVLQGVASGQPLVTVGDDLIIDIASGAF